MKDDFDSGMGIPDDELAGGSASEGDALGGHNGDVDLEAPGSEPVGRASGGARAMQSSGGAKPAPRKPAPAKKAAVKNAARKTAVKKSGGKKAVKKGAKKATTKAAKKGSSKKKSAKKSGAKKGKKKGGRR